MGVPPPHLPVPITDFRNFGQFWGHFELFCLDFISFLCIAEIMCRLQVRPVLSRRPRRRIPELLPSGHRPDLVYHKGERVLCIGGLLVVDGAETAMTNAAFAAHCLQPCAMFAPKRTVCVSWVAHGFSFFFSARRAADGTASLRFLPAFCISLPALPPSCIAAGSAQPPPGLLTQGLFAEKGVGIFRGIKKPP